MTERARALEALRRVGLVDGADGRERLVLRTSGSTGAPRAVVRTVDSWTDSFAAFSDLTGIGPADTVLLPLPAESSSMLAFALAHTVAVGASCHPLARWSPARAAAATACTAAHLTPTMLGGLLDALTTRGPAPSPGTLGTVVCAGAALPAPLGDRAAAAGLRVVDYYGATELSFVAIRHPDGVMRAFPGVDIDLRDGEIWVRSPYVCEGYAQGTTGPFRMAPGGWCTVGDRGTRADDGGLTVSGRGDDLVLTGGVCVLPADVEAALAGAPGVGSVVVVGLPHPELGQLVAAVLTPHAEAPPDAVVLRRHAARQLSPTHRPRRWYTAPELPLTASGKVDRARVRQGLADGGLDATPLG